MTKKELWKEIFSYVKIVVVTSALVILVNKTLVANAKVPTGSMEDTIKAGSRILINRLAYQNETPKRGDIVSFYCPDEPDTLYLKRVMALPGETIEGKDGEVYVDGTQLEEPYIKAKSYQDFGPYTVPDSMYFMMGDNRNRSRDSRAWKNKFVDKGAIIGKAKVAYFPELKVFD